MVVCAGPFSGLGSAPARAALQEATHYVDIADDREYIRRLRQLDGEFRGAGRCAAYGCSSLPGVSSALALSLVEHGAPPERARVTLFIGAANPKGKASVRAMVERLGRPVRTAAGERRGFGDPQTIPLPLPFGPRTAYTFDGPEHDLFPSLLGVDAVDVRVGFELPIANAGFALLARMGARWGRRTSALLSRVAARGAQSGRHRRLGDGRARLEGRAPRRAGPGRGRGRAADGLTSLRSRRRRFGWRCVTRHRSAAADGGRRARGTSVLAAGGGAPDRRRLMPVVLFFGGNGHASARLQPARAALERMTRSGAITPFDIVEVPYPGFEDRPRAADAREFLAALADAVAGPSEGQGAIVYATGIGALFAVTLRAHGQLGRRPLVLQGPVLWGLERRWMPRLARAGLAPLVPRLFRQRAFQRHFIRRHFAGPPSRHVESSFFEGYARCAAAADLFQWCGPAWLRDVEEAVRERPRALDGVQVWWGGRDRVVGPDELRATEAALGVRWPERTLRHWGHYPMIEDPEGWVREVAATVPREVPFIIGR